MNRDAALEDLTSRLESRLTGVALAHLADGPIRIPEEVATELAKVALEWAVTNGLPLD